MATMLTKPTIRPITASATIVSTSTGATATTSMATPATATLASRIRPGRARCRLPATSVPASAPAPHAALSRPRPAGPALNRISASHGIPTAAGPLRAKFRIIDSSSVIASGESART